jgi:hypothetical protein
MKTTSTAFFPVIDEIPLFSVNGGIHTCDALESAAAFLYSAQAVLMDNGGNPLSYQGEAVGTLITLAQAVIRSILDSEVAA